MLRAAFLCVSRRVLDTLEVYREIRREEKRDDSSALLETLHSFVKSYLSLHIARVLFARELICLVRLAAELIADLPFEQSQ